MCWSLHGINMKGNPCYSDDQWWHSGWESKSDAWSLWKWECWGHIGQKWHTSQRTLCFQHAVRLNTAMSKTHCPENSCLSVITNLPLEFRFQPKTYSQVHLKLTMKALFQTRPRGRLKHSLSSWLPFPNDLRHKNLPKLFRCGWERRQVTGLRRTFVRL